MWLSRKELKSQAKLSLQGKYGEVIKLLFIFFGINVASSYVCTIFNFPLIIQSVISLCINSLFGFGIISFFLKISRNENISCQELFSKTHLFIPYLSINILVSIITFLWTLLFIIPGIIASLSYSLVYLVALDNPELDTMNVLRKSKEMMKGHKLELFVLIFSFLGWIILSIFTLGILLLWIVPYMQVTFANFYNKLKEQN